MSHAMSSCAEKIVSELFWLRLKLALGLSLLKEICVFASISEDPPPNHSHNPNHPSLFRKEEKTSLQYNEVEC